MHFSLHKITALLIVLLLSSSSSVIATRDECYTTVVIIGTLFASFLIVLVVFGMVYLAYIRPRYKQYQRDVAECRARHGLDDHAVIQSEPDGEYRPDQGSYYSTSGNIPFVFTVRPPTPAMSESAYNQGRISPYRAAYREAMSTACRMTNPDDCAHRYSSGTVMSGAMMTDHPTDGYRVSYRYPHDLPRATEEDLRDAQGLSSIFGLRTAATTRRTRSLDPIGTRV